jgi:hypothetical protein
MELRDTGATCNPSLLSKRTFSISLFMTIEKVLELTSDVYQSPDDCNAGNYPQSRRYKERNILPIGENQMFVFMAQDLTILTRDYAQFGI